MPTRDPTEVEREDLRRLREEEIKASYARGLPRGAVWLVLVLVLVVVVAVVITVLD